MDEQVRARRMITLGYDEFDDDTWNKFRAILLEQGLSIKDWVASKIREEMETAEVLKK